MSKIYHCLHTCNYCGGVNKTVRVVDCSEGYVNECETKCQESNCGLEDYWGYGFFESADEGFDACEKY